MGLVWQISLALEVALLVVFALAVATSLLTRKKDTGAATVSAYPHRPLREGRERDRHAA